MRSRGSHRSVMFLVDGIGYQPRRRGLGRRNRRTAESLRALDRDEDGPRSAEECAEKGEHGPSSKEMVQTLMAFDKNGDGLLTDDEMSPDWRVSSSRNACFNWTRMAMAASRRTSEPQGSAFSWNSHGSRSES